MDKRRGFWAGYKKLGPVSRWFSKLTVLGIAITLVVGVMQYKTGATKKDVKDLPDIKDKLSQLTNDDFDRGKVVRRSLENRLYDLKESISLLEEALTKVKSGDKNYYKIISAQLRALVCSGKSRTLNPLLLNLADEKKVYLKCYAPPIDVMLELLTAPVLIIDPRFIVSANSAIGLKEYEFKKWMTTSVLVLHKESYTANEIIKMAAEKMGGVHYDEYIPEKLIKLEGIGYFSEGSEKFNEIEKVLIQVAEVTIYLGKIVISE